ncbi:hypothetical protein [Paenibacillus sp. GSMTC-2017]|uniref:hypothetical protein n=1 Tax=Paenibacillus sp. GSMTC-2017 TaxID=2794350 RepID=UPI0018D94EA9|nr:hypothetical protein [Paenibacillus sp. GSMTC-2017]
MNDKKNSLPKKQTKFYDTTAKCSISNPHYTDKLVQEQEFVNSDYKLFLQKKGHKEQIKNDLEQHAVIVGSYELLI